MYAFNGATEMSIDEVFRQAAAFGITLIEFTGGEPLLQREVPLLVNRFLEGGNTVLIETNGSIGIDIIDPEAIIIMDIKTPSSGMEHSFCEKNIGFLKRTDEVKFVISDRRDYDWAQERIDVYDLARRCRILLSPAFAKLKPDVLADWMVRDASPARLNLQIHKYLFSPDARGV